MKHIKRKIQFVLAAMLLPVLLSAWMILPADWIVEKHEGYQLLYTDADKENKNEYLIYINNGIKSVKATFKNPFKETFEIYIHPNRTSLDTQWQNDWKLPEFKSQCWMVASGVSKKLDLLSPKIWDQQACEHTYTDKTHTQRLITHELIHVYHGQFNASPDFSDVSGLDWFVEGLATYASGQCDSKRMSEVKEAVLNNTIPDTLDKFWTGTLKYGLSGSVVMFIAHKYGNDKLNALLNFNRKSQLLKALDTTEADLLKEWKAYMEKL